MSEKSSRKIAALIIWWCEGTKAREDKRGRKSLNKAIEVTNTDPRIIKIFTDFLREELKIPNDKLKGQVQIHQGDDQDGIEDYWTKVAGITKGQLNKTIIRKIGNKPGKNYGTFKIRVYGIQIFDHLTKLLEDELKCI